MNNNRTHISIYFCATCRRSVDVKDIFTLEAAGIVPKSNQTDRDLVHLKQNFTGYREIRQEDFCNEEVLQAQIKLNIEVESISMDNFRPGIVNQ